VRGQGHRGQHALTEKFLRLGVSAAASCLPTAVNSIWPALSSLDQAEDFRRVAGGTKSLMSPPTVSARRAASAFRGRADCPAR